MELKINLKSLVELLDYQSRSLCGRILKRFEIIDNKEILKADIKELLYEEMRNLRDLLIALGRGFEPTIFNFKSRDK